jgi:hypothetical protein
MSNHKTGFFCVVLFLFFFFAGSLHAADGLIEKVTFHGKNGKTESVIFHLNGPWLPRAFALKGEKPRVVFDFIETRLARSVPSSIDIQGEMIRKVRLGRHTNKTRVVIDLVAGEAFNFVQQFDENENILTIQIFPEEVPQKEKVVLKEVAEVKEVEQVAATTPELEEVVAVTVEEAIAVGVIAEEPEQEIVEVVEPVEGIKTVEVLELPQETLAKSSSVVDALLVDVSFENTADKGEMILFKLNGFYPPTVSGQEEGPPLVICDFVGTRLGEKVVKIQETRGEYVERVRVEQVDDSDLIRVTLQLVPNKDYDLQQVFFKEDNLFVIIVNSYTSSDAEKE